MRGREREKVRSEEPHSLDVPRPRHLERNTRESMYLYEHSYQY